MKHKHIIRGRTRLAHRVPGEDCLDNSWSDTGRVKGPTGRRSSKGGV